MTKPHLTPLSQSLPASVPFVGPEAQERQQDQTFKARLGANENTFGPSPKAIAAMQKAASEVWMYGDPESYDLRQALAKHHNIGPDNIMIGRRDRHAAWGARAALRHGRRRGCDLCRGLPDL